ncbi:MAG: hypothetical protein LVR00_05305 [Rhabdochlamydiaceae bacterium]|jgi:hypothetical protein
MQIKINEKVLSLPPYISTSWKNIISLQVSNTVIGPILIIELISGSRIEIPNLEAAVMEDIFTAHSLFLEKQVGKKNPEQPSLTFPFDLLAGPAFSGMQEMSTLFQHNGAQAETPDLPQELLDKMITLAKTMGVEETSLPKSEPHCNCPHCQIIRAFHPTTESAPLEEEVSDEDLKFRTWDINKEGDQLYTVTNPLNSAEHYSVFLGQPIGCTCGEKNCEHIQAVLRS